MSSTAVAQTSNTSSSSSSSSTSSITGNGSVSEMFLKLLVAQIQNQDPLSPTDPSQMVNQLTQLSQMEALQAMSTQGSTNAGLLSSLQVMTLGGQVGSTVQVQASQLNLDSTAVQTHFTLGSSSGKVQLVLTASDGTETRVQLGSRSVGSNDYTLDPKALGLSSGTYQVRVEDESGNKISVEVEAEITGVRLTGNGGAVISLGALGEYDPGAITQFKGRTTTTQS